eukprot:m.50336 g.50336  ORF g.50336 m.50336 type:complete len:150 (+) comp15372_c0_seq2:1514-1963(+)
MATSTVAPITTPHFTCIAAGTVAKTNTREFCTHSPHTGAPSSALCAKYIAARQSHRTNTACYVHCRTHSYTDEHTVFNIAAFTVAPTDTPYAECIAPHTDQPTVCSVHSCTHSRTDRHTECHVHSQRAVLTSTPKTVQYSCLQENYHAQ